MSNIRMLAPEEEADVEVSWQDQEKINTFSKLNAKTDDLEEEYEYVKQEKEYLDDLLLELELADEDEKFRYKIGDAYIHIPLPELQIRLEEDKTKLNERLETIKSTLDSNAEHMAELKKVLYARFGNAINLERD
ncbi:hypothetical protein BZG36_01719 [Bifiguratus adelaidae]|uniref:Prefoldin subunit 4 n=1 Tax=Bifiguratus adelaidae TaxID=1938954 RepID=A0A261Y4Q7_9FUNG|nr:hypothetical protein BZG36_01719 [Bifiguratus adelaidae]